MTFWKWSRTAADNGTADSTCPFPEGMSPAALNDGARGMMAAAAKYRDDVAGAITTGGTATAYTVNSYQSFDSLAHLDGKGIAFTPHTTNGASVTLNVDGLGAKPLRAQPSVDLQSGVLIQGTPYLALYNNSDAVFYLFGVGSNPGIPLGSSIDYWGSSAPTSAYALAYGQAISRTTYSALFSLFGTTYGTGDGSATFNIPDLRGRVIAGKDDMGGSAASRLTSSYFGASAAALGAVGGSESNTLTAAQLPAHIHPNTLSDPGHSHTDHMNVAFGASGSTFGIAGSVSSGTTSTNATGMTINNAANTGGGGAHNNTQPTIIANKLLRII
jgi:microcystin-dependent protein